MTGLAIDAALVLHALTHRSFAYEHAGQVRSERLEFLGSAAVSLGVSDVLYSKSGHLSEGELEKLRTAVINMHSVADVARRCVPGGLGQYIRLGRGEAATGGRDKDSILAGALKAIVGAVYLQHGMDTTSRLVARLFEQAIAAATQDPGGGPDWKTNLQELTASQQLGMPEYTVRDRGPQHERRFTATVLVGGAVVGEGEGGSKKQAQQYAAQQACATLGSANLG
ncbi:ribonuclease III [Nocardia sp. NPDC050630]|uniref:ribonuclease III n=1 Tax=Nocardia sp. NPDC050630 TaxID=3364321 RepID=UPI0037AD916C